MSLVAGDTDSERFFALITRETRRTGDVGEGITAAARWVAEHLPLFAINLVLISAEELWALRYPDTHDLLVLERAAGGPPAAHTSSTRAPAAGSACTPRTWPTSRAVVVATERMDDDPGWSTAGLGRAAARRRRPERAPAGGCSTGRRRTR